jgi:hypothetical protein
MGVEVVRAGTRRWAGRLTACVMLTMASAAPGVVLAADSGFEGISWGATVAQLEASLDGKLAARECAEQERNQPELKRYARSCGPVIEDYRIDGISFVAFFGVRGADGPLQAIYLDRVATVTNEQIRAGQGSEYRYNRVKKVLMDRHGTPARVSETDDRPRDKPALLSTEWVTGDSTITLAEAIVSEKRGQQYYLSIIYAPVHQ